MTVESKRYDIGIRKVNMHRQTNFGQGLDQMEGRAMQEFVF